MIGSHFLALVAAFFLAIQGGRLSEQPAALNNQAPEAGHGAAAAVSNPVDIGDRVAWDLPRELRARQ